MRGVVHRSNSTIWEEGVGRGGGLQISFIQLVPLLL